MLNSEFSIPIREDVHHSAAPLGWELGISELSIGLE
jgi:hypothetical protein